MLKYLLSAIIGICLIINTAWGQTPHAVIKAPDEVESGQSVWLKTNDSVGEKFIWKVLPVDADQYFTELPIYGGLEQLPGPDGVLNTEDDIYKPIVHYWAHFETTKDGLYHFVLVAITSNEGDVAVHTTKVGSGDDDDDDDDVDPNPILIIPEPTDSYKQLVIGIPNYMTGQYVQNDSYKLAKFFKDLSDMISVDIELATTSDIRMLNIELGKQVFSNSGIKDRYDPLDKYLDQAVGHALGYEIAPLNNTKRSQAVQVFNAIAWQMYQIYKSTL